MRKNFPKLVLPEIVFSSSSVDQSREIGRLLKNGYLRKLLPRVYTSNLEEKEEVLIRKNLWLIISHIFPGVMLSHRSALEFQPSPKGCLYLTGKNRRTYSWPGLTIRMSEGPSILEDDRPVFGSLYVSSLERACLENLSQSRAVSGEKRTVERDVLEERLLSILMTRGEKGLNELRERARQIAGTFSWKAEFDQLNLIISALMATQPRSILQSPLAVAAAFGEPYDAGRFFLFQNLVGILAQMEFVERLEKTNDQEKFAQIAFFESYFSNFIEGTTFEVEEAYSIVFQGKIIPNRTGDSHDILGTYELCFDRFQMKHTADEEEEFLTLLKARHQTILKARPEKSPGQFKTLSNRAGSTLLVEPPLVAGTLKKGFGLLRGLSHPFARAVYMMFLISEVHPFEDGNGRLARIMMNAELVRSGMSKILIPTVYRDDYILNLKRLTRQQDPQGYIRMMQRAHAFSHWLEPGGYESLYSQLSQANAFRESSEAVLFFPEQAT